MLDSKRLKGSEVITQDLETCSLALPLQNPINPSKTVRKAFRIKRDFCILEINEGEMYRDF